MIRRREYTTQDNNVWQWIRPRLRVEAVSNAHFPLRLRVRPGRRLLGAEGDFGATDTGRD